MTFDQSAFADTIHSIRRELELINQTVAWLSPSAYEHQTGGSNRSGSTICRNCSGNSDWRDDKGRPCHECIVTTIGDVGEIVIRRHHLARHLEQAADDVDSVWATVKGTRGRIAKLANLIDRGISPLPGMDPPTVDPREVAQAVAKRAQRVRQGEELAPLPDVAKSASSTLKAKVKLQDTIDAKRAANERDVPKSGNRWRK